MMLDPVIFGKACWKERVQQIPDEDSNLGTPENFLFESGVAKTKSTESEIP